MKPCAGRVLGGYSEELEDGRIEVGVKMAYLPTAGMCLAMPTEEKAKIKIFSMDAKEIVVRGLMRRPDLGL